MPLDIELVLRSGAPKQSKKTAEKQKAKVIEDKTFGLKNKNRSAKVQQYVQQVKQNVNCSNRDEMKHKAELQEKRAAKQDKKAFEEAMNKLMREEKKPKGEGSDSDEDEEEEEEDKQLGVSPEEYLWTAEDFDNVEFDAGRLEEILESERAKLADRKDLTKVTEETFKAWREKKHQEKLAKEAKRLESAKQGKGKLKGWDLWNAKRELFVDDEDAEETFEKEFEDASLFENEDEDFDPDAEEDDESATAASK